jgi:hypothetical protein
MILRTEEVTTTDGPRDGPSVGKHWQVVRCLDLEENDSFFDFAVGVESGHDQVVPVIALHSLDGAAAEQYVTFKMIDAEVGQYVFTRAQLSGRNRHFSGPRRRTLDGHTPPVTAILDPCLPEPFPGIAA